MTEKPHGAGKSSFELIDRSMFFDLLDLKEGSAFLDVGCGRGDYTLAAAQLIGQTGKVYALDLWPESIRSLEKEIEIKSLTNIHPMIADASELIPLDNDSVEVCLMATVFHDLARDESHHSALIEIKRVLKSGGRLAIMEFKKIDGTPGPSVEIRLSPEELDAVIIPEGFKKVTESDLGDFNYLSIYTKT